MPSEGDYRDGRVSAFREHSVLWGLEGVVEYKTMFTVECETVPMWSVAQTRYKNALLR